MALLVMHGPLRPPKLAGTHIAAHSRCAVRVNPLAAAALVIRRTGRIDTAGAQISWSWSFLFFFFCFFVCFFLFLFFC